VTRLVLAVIAVAAIAAAARAAAPDASVRPPLLRDVGLEPHLGAALPLDVPLRDEDGAAVTLGRYLDGRRPAVLVFAYYGCPMLCSQVLNALTRSVKALAFDVGNEFDVVVVSFDPRDGPDAARAKKADIVARYGRGSAGAGWHFLGGDAPSVRRLTDAAGFRYAWDEVGQQFAHVAVVLVVTPDGRIARYFPGIEYPPRDLRLGLVEASAGRIGTTVDRLLLFCYHYDAATGRYTPAIESALRVGGVLTVLGLGALIVGLRRREGAAA
jgi:protein SCO1